MNKIDAFLNTITMYRLLLCYLIGLLIIAFLYSLFGFFSFTPYQLAVSSIIFIFGSQLCNLFFAKIFHADTNYESSYISGLILVLIVSPAISLTSGIFFLWAIIWTIASKYVINLKGKHIFNPVAFGVWMTGVGFHQYASWWVGTAIMMPFVLIGGIVLIRKIRREDLVFSFFVVALAIILFFSLINGNPLTTTIQKLLLDTPFFFLAFVMLTEPLTTPPTKRLQIYYGGLVGLLFSPQFHTTPEIALLIGNIYTYFVSSKETLFLKLQTKVQTASDMVDFIFEKPASFSFQPGQYMEWTLPHTRIDQRGNRRYFTLASSPTEKNIILGVRFYQQSSSYKRMLYNLPSGGKIIGRQLSGDFTLPQDKNKNLVFIAGGIGITPFRSMVKYLLDIGEKRDIVLFYSVKKENELVYRNIFDEAAKKLKIKTIYTLTDTTRIPRHWKGSIGRIDNEVITKEVPDYANRIFYLSGPNAFIKSFEKTLKNMHIPSSNVKVDYFRGL